MFLIMQLNLTCRKYHIHSPKRKNKDETCSEEQMMTIQIEDSYQQTYMKMNLNILGSKKPWEKKEL